MFRELIASNPSDFQHDGSTFDKLVRMQHHALPTRLLDITSNPLMALFFAVSELPESPAEVIKFKIKRSSIFFFDSDTTSVISNLARMELHAKDAIANSASQSGINVQQFNQQTNIQVMRLLHAIRDDKPSFRAEIRPSDVLRVICVKSKMTNSRIVSQAGSFLLFGHKGTLPRLGNTEIVIDSIRINMNDKETIRQQLDNLNINEATVYPYIENSAKYIKKRYGK